MLNFRLIPAIISTTLLISCEGPMGPEGPRGPTGARGPAGIGELILIEEYLDEEDRGEDFYFISDFRIKPSTVVEIYIKLDYDDTGVFYTPIYEWAEQEGLALDITYLITNNLLESKLPALAIWDPNKRLEFQTVVVVIARQ